MVPDLDVSPEYHLFLPESSHNAKNILFYILCSMSMVLHNTLQNHTRLICSVLFCTA